ncbi:MAG: DNA recombination protein RmuC [Bacteroidia bacterium]|nr:DNA recombination protein RmuC [Bacteroidia bacterium]
MELEFWKEPIWWVAMIVGLLGGFFVAWILSQRKIQQGKLSVVQAQAERDNLQQQMTIKDAEWQRQQQRHDQREAEFNELSRAYARLEEGYAQLETRLRERLEEVSTMQEQFKLHFQTISQQIVEKNSQQLSAEHQERLQQVLGPLKERIQAFEQKVQSAYEEENRERFSLRKEIEKLVVLNQHMSEEARNLTKALKGESKTQGNWGELVLSRVLESSGLREGEEYLTQGKELALRDDDGRLRQPDVIIKLPDDKHLLIDAKVSLVAYERFSSAEMEDSRLSALNEHILSVRRHVQQLSDKHYATLSGVNSPEFVLMFMPIEPAFHLAIQSDQELFSFAWDRKIVLVSPTTLLATLRTVASVWKLERRNHNAEEIAKQGGALYDKLVGFVEELTQVGTHLDRALRSQQQAMNKLKDGHGSLTKRAEKLRELGAKNKKELPES